MKRESKLMTRLRAELPQTCTMTWQPRKKTAYNLNTPSGIPNYLHILPLELRTLTKHGLVSEVTTMVRKSIPDGAVRQYMTFVVKDLGYMAWVYDNHELIRFYFVPDCLMGNRVIKRALNNINRMIHSFMDDGGLLVYLSRLHATADDELTKRLYKQWMDKKEGALA